MAEPKKTAQGTWRILIEVKGVRDSKTFPTKREATEWRDKRVMELRHSSTLPEGKKHTLKDAFDKYADEVSVTKRGERWEIVRLKSFESQALPIRKSIQDVTTLDLIAWRDERLKIIQRGTILRDISLLSAVFEMARRDWGWIEVNPMKDVRKPAQPDHRERLITGVEIRKMLRAMGYTKQVRTVSQSAAHCFLMALATGMRAGELCGISWAHVRVDSVILPMTKNGSAREVPLSPVAQKIIERMNGWDAELLFGLRSQSLDALFRKYRDRAGLSGFTFHDSRHTAATRMAAKLHVLELCKVMGWKRTDQALTYFNPKASDLAQKLAAPIS